MTVCPRVPWVQAGGLQKAPAQPPSQGRTQPQSTPRPSPTPPLTIQEAFSQLRHLLLKGAPELKGPHLHENGGASGGADTEQASGVNCPPPGPWPP